MVRKPKTPFARLWVLCLISLIGPMSSPVSCAEILIWEELTVPLKQTFRFSATEPAIVRVTMPSDILSASNRISIFFRINEYNPRLNPYVIVNGNRQAFYYMGGDGIVNIRSDHLRPGQNELLFSEQSTTGDIIFIHEMRHLQP